MIVERRKSVTEEKRIVTGLVVSTKFIEQVHSSLELDYFTNSYLKTIASWCLSFFEEHKKAPYKHIQDIYESEIPHNSDADNELIEKVLSTLSEQYDEDALNVDYLKGVTNSYIRERELEILVNNISVLKESGDISEAEEMIKNFRKVNIEVSMDHIINPGDLEQKKALYREMEEEEQKFFQLPGDLGKYLGNHKKGDVVAYFAPAKIGKSFVLVNNFKAGIMKRKKTLMWSAEMIGTEVNARVDKAFMPMVDVSDGEGYYKFPTFDCLMNQMGDCSDRLSKVVILEDDEEIDDPNHVPCTKCMYSDPKRYRQAIYMDTIFREQQDLFTIQNKFYTKNNKPKEFVNLMNKYGRISAPPKYSLSYDWMMRDLDNLFERDGYIPEILILDYIDILEIDSHYDDYRLEDERWKLCAKIAGATDTLFITVTQSNKSGFNADHLTTEHQGGFYGKVRHVNLMVGLNQSESDKAKGIMRFGITEARSQRYIQNQTCTVLQDLVSGQAYLDAYCPYLKGSKQ
jgi:hypothetical protein